MRISTSMIFGGNVNALNDKTANLLKVQQQISSGHRILTPADDPIAAAQVLELSQSAAINTQYQTAQTSAKGTLGIVDNQLSSVTDILTRIRELGVQAGNAVLSTSDRQSISTELRSHYEELVGIANSTDGNGQYLFSGYQGANKPFAGSVETGVSYYGDDGQRSVRVSGGRTMPLSVAGNDVFMNVKNGNGTFVTAPATQRSVNTGSASIDAGTVTDPIKWTASGTPAKINVNFWSDASNVLGGGAGAVYYDLVNATTGNSLFTGAPPVTGVGGSYTHGYTSGASITLSNAGAPAFDYGASIKISGTPASGDSFVLTASSSSGGNGFFTTSPALTSASNLGSGIIDAGSVSDLSKWNSTANSGQLEVRLWQNNSVSPAVMYYDLVDAKDGKSLYTGTSSTAGGAGNTFTHAFTSGNAISFNGLVAPYNDFGVSVTISGTPVSGDAFSLNRSTQNGLFSMLAGMIKTVEAPPATGNAGNTQMQSQLATALTSLSQVEDNVLRVRSAIGSRLGELDNLSTTAQGLDTQYQSNLSDLQNVDYNKAITDLTRTQTELQATQQSFVKIANMSLFNYLT
jgi:flagellar hook-associated protein 3 FlgL